MKKTEIHQLMLEAYLEVLQEQDQVPAEEVPTQEPEPAVLPKPEKKPIPQEVKQALRKVIGSLFGSSHLDFIEKIQLVVPKPSEFQVFLKNGQSFYLKWMGKSPDYDTRVKLADAPPSDRQGAFQAEIEGKRYFLGSLPQYEQALDRLGDLLKNGPISTGQEGGEFGAPAPEGGAGGGGADFPGGEEGSAATDFGAPAPEGGEIPGEEEFGTPETEPGEEVPTSL